MGNGYLNRRPTFTSILLILGAWGAMLLAACSPGPREPSKDVVFELIPRDKLPAFSDDGDAASLQKAAEASLTFFERISEDQRFTVGERELSPEILKDSLLHFLKLLQSNHLSRDSVAAAFDVYRIGGGNERASSLVTGYYEPIVEGRLQREPDFSFPLYSLPPDLVTIDLAAFDPRRFPGERLVGRLHSNRVVPYYTRAEIDGAGRLDSHGCQLVWLRDPVDAFFLQVQGSGMVRLEDGRLARIGYAGTNGRPYRSIGKVLIDQGVLTSEEMSMQAIRSYLHQHPERRDEVMRQNESYVFFRWVPEGPLGSLNLSLTAERSIATDPRFFPRGALAYLETQQPHLNEAGQLLGRKPLNRWVLNQDTGGAIKGPGRVDLFCGTGAGAEAVAGRLKHPGLLYLLVKKNERLKSAP